MAVTVFADVMGTEQVPVPVQAPDQPVNRLPDAAVAVRETVVVSVNDREHVVPHEIPVGLDVTVPVPVPALVTVNVYDAADTCPAGIATIDNDRTTTAEIKLRNRSTCLFWLIGARNLRQKGSYWDGSSAVGFDFPLSV